MNLLSSLLGMLQQLASLLLAPLQMLGKLFQFRNLSPAARYAIEAGLVLVVFGGMVALNWFFDLQRFLTGPLWARKIWLGLLAVLAYAAFRLVIFIVQQLPSQALEFPDIDEALEAGLAAMQEARVDLSQTPLFLVVGMMPEFENSFAESSLVGRDVRVTGHGLPIHFYGNEKALWLTLPGCSALTEQSYLAMHGEVASMTRPVGFSDAAATLDPSGGTGAGRFETMGAGGGSGGRFSTLAGADFEAATGSATLGDSPTSSLPPPPQDEGYKSSQRMSLDAKELARVRLEYFIEKLRKLRYPFCPANGVLLCLPYEWITSPGLSQLSDTAKIDMFALQDKLGVKCLSVAVFTGIEKSDEFREYMERLDRAQLERRCGCSFPALVSLDAADIDRSYNWIIEYFERQIFDLYQKKLGDPGNGKLFRMLDHLRKYRPNFSRMLNNAYPRDVREPFYFGGVYFASIPALAGVRLPFFEGVLAKLLKENDDVIGWNDQSLVEDSRLRRLSSTVMAGVVVMTVVVALIILDMLFPGIRASLFAR